MSEETLTPNQSWLLLAIRREPGSLTTLILKSDMGVAIRHGAQLDESRLIRDLKELERLKLAREVGGLWEPCREQVKEIRKQLQGSLFDDSDA